MASVSPSPRVFAVMPFRKPFFDDLYELAIRAPAARCGFSCIRGDLIDEPGFVLSQIHEETIAADIVVADMTQKNPNVFYEVGCAQTLGKHVILLASSEDELTAFDTNHFRHHIYDGSIATARKIMTRQFSNFRQHLLPDAQLFPGSECIWAWPNEAPTLDFKSGTPGQIDINGGQSIIETPTGPVLRVQHTSRKWNHLPGWSIMYFFSRNPVKDFREGDRFVLALETSSRGSCQIELQFAGGNNAEKNWINFGWCKGTPKAGGWRQFSLPLVELTATGPGYSPAQGIRVHMRTNTGNGKIDFRSIRLIKLPRAEAAAESGA